MSREPGRRDLSQRSLGTNNPGSVGGVEMATPYAKDVADLRAILTTHLIGNLHEAAEVVDFLDPLVRDQIPIRLCDAIVLAN